VGGLGNQLFQLANLVATARRNNLRPWLRRHVAADSNEQPRPTYWETPLLAAGKNRLFATTVPDIHPSVLPPAALTDESSGVTAGARDCVLAAAESEALLTVPLTSVPESRPCRPIRVAPTTPTQAGTASSGAATQSLGSYNLIGFFQSPAYFEDHKDEVLSTLFPLELRVAARRYIERRFAAMHSGLEREGHSLTASTTAATPQLSPESEVETVVTAVPGSSGLEASISVSHPTFTAIHVRRGDYLRTRDTFEALSFDEYYCRALEILYGRRALLVASSPSSASLHRVLIFCDDVAWGQTVAAALEARYPAVSCCAVSGLNDASASASASATLPKMVEDFPELTACPTDVQELLLMAACDDVVCANSSFSWWAAYVCANDATRIGGTGRAVAPQKWCVKEKFPEALRLYPSNWIVV
jgi:hypothetical protein